MRITEKQRRAVVEEIRRTFGAASRIWLFGSRADDHARGGDVDLYVEAEIFPPAGRALNKLDAVVALERILGDQSVDLIVRFSGDPEQPIHRIARRSGVPL
ncbi:MAG: nucleotidyltransferase domain-containing protein [Acidimicrobiia bacterium]